MTTSIEWTDKTWNPVAGCNAVSAGCTNCYAATLAYRLEVMGMDKYAGLTRKSSGRAVWTGKLTLDEKALELPRRWRKPRLVCVNSMSDLFHPDVPVAYIARVWAVMQDTPHHTYQILTNRPERMLEVLSRPAIPVLPNVWLGTSVEDGRVLGRIDVLRQVPAAVRFISCGPLIGSVAGADLTGIDWAIVGGESGHGARAMEAKWVKQILRLCRRSGVAFFSSNGVVRRRSSLAVPLTAAHMTRCRAISRLSHTLAVPGTKSAVPLSGTSATAVSSSFCTGRQ